MNDFPRDFALPISKKSELCEKVLKKSAECYIIYYV